MMKRYLLLSGGVCAAVAVLLAVFWHHVAAVWREAVSASAVDIASELGALAAIALSAAVLITVAALKGRWRLAGQMSRLIINRSEDLDFQHLHLATWLGILSLPLITFLLLVFTLDATRQQALDQGQHQVRVLSQVVAEQTSRTLHGIDLVLRGIAMDLEMRRPDPARDASTTRAWMARTIRDEPVMRSVWVTDGQGRVVLHTEPKGVGLDASQRDYFLHHLRPGASELHVGDVTRSLIDGSWFVPVSRRFSNPDGGLAGVVVAAWEPRQFSREWAAVDVGPGGSIALFSWSAQLLMRTPYVEEAIGRSLADDPVFRSRTLVASEGSYRRPSPIDGLDRILAFRRVSGPPGYAGFIVVAGVTVDHILGSWRRFAVLSLAVWLTFTVALAIFGRILLEQIARRAADARKLRDIARFPEDNPSPILRTDQEGRILYTNSAARAIIAGLTDPAEQAAFKYLIENTATATTAEHRTLTIASRCFEAEITPLANATLGIYLIDTTERRIAISRLRDSEERLRLALETSGLGLFDLDFRSGRMIVNPRYALMLDLDPISFEESIETWSARLHPDDRDQAVDLIRCCQAGRIPDYQTEFRQHAGGGAWKWLLSVARIVEWDAAGAPARLIGTLMDITDRKLRDRDRERNEALSQLLLSLGSLAGEVPEPGLVATGLEGLCRITGSQRASLQFVDDDQVRISDSVQFPVLPSPTWSEPHYPTGVVSDCLGKRASVMVAADADSLWRTACVPILADDRVRVIVEVERNHEDYDSDILNLLHLFADHLWEIVQHQRAEQALRDSESRLKAMTDSTKDAIIMIDHGGLVSFWNPAAETMFDYSVAEALGQDVHLLLAGEKGQEYRQAWASFARTTTDITRTREVIGYRKDGRTVPVEITISTFRRGSQWNAVGVLRDITERKEAEQQKWQAQKMDSLGALAGGIAHDINNLLMPVLGMTESVLDKLPPDSPLRERLDLVMDAAQRIKELVERILTFSRKQGVQYEPLDIAQVVHDAIPLVRATTPASMAIRERLDPATGIVAADITQLHAVLLNLASNAAHALEGRPGHLDISLDRIIADADLVRTVSALVEGRSYAHLSIADDGCGMDARTLERLFDPFFTTREVGEGTGLGTAIVHGIITKHDGAIRVHSTPGRGTVFDIYLPINIPGRR